MFKIAITEAAFEPIARTLPLGSVGFENKTNERGEKLVRLRGGLGRARRDAGAGRELQRRDPAAGEGDDANESDEGEAMTLEEIVESECAMFIDGEARYGRYFKHARAATMDLSLCVVSVDRDRSHTFGRLFSLMKKHHTLAFLSTLRLHRVQAMLNLRQVLEAGAGAAYAIANPDVRGFADIDAFGIIDPSQELAKKHYRWLGKNYPDSSKWIRDTKDQINNQMAHANIVSADATFRVGQTPDVIDLPFFDAEDEYIVQTDLWQIGSVAIKLMGLFYLVKENVPRTTGRSVLEFRLDFQNTFRGLAAESVALQDEIKGK